jgi:hypothetical protein
MYQGINGAISKRSECGREAIIFEEDQRAIEALKLMIMIRRKRVIF